MLRTSQNVCLTLLSPWGWGGGSCYPPSTFWILAPPSTAHVTLVAASHFAHLQNADSKDTFLGGLLVRSKGDTATAGKSPALNKWPWLLLAITIPGAAVTAIRPRAVSHKVMERIPFGGTGSNSITPNTVDHSALAVGFNLSGSPYSSLPSTTVNNRRFYPIHRLTR